MVARYAVVMWLCLSVCLFVRPASVHPLSQVDVLLKWLNITITQTTPHDRRQPMDSVT